MFFVEDAILFRSSLWLVASIFSPLAPKIPVVPAPNQDTKETSDCSAIFSVYNCLAEYLIHTISIILSSYTLYLHGKSMDLSATQCNVDAMQPAFAFFSLPVPRLGLSEWISQACRYSVHASVLDNSPPRRLRAATSRMGCKLTR
jgi:hypothetical protein